MSLAQFFSILRARWLAAFLILATTLALAVTWILLRPTQYTARTAVLVDIRTDPVGGSSLGMFAPTYLATQIDIVRSDRVAQRVVQTLGLDRSPEVIRAWQEATQGRGTPAVWVARELQSGLEVKPARETSIISIGWTGANAEEAKRIANAFAQAYLDTTLELKTEPARRYAVWFEEQLAASRKNLEQAQTKLSQYQQRAGIVADNQGLDFETARLNDISAQLTVVQGQTTESQSKRGASSDTVADVMQSSLINALKTDILKLETKIQETSSNLGPGHPQMVQAAAELGALRSKLASETARISRSIDTAYRVSVSRERELRGALAAQKARVLAINRQRDEHGVLRRELESAQKAYELVAASTAQARLQSLTNQTNVMRLAAADEPLTPTGPSGKQVLMIAMVGGLLLAIAGALLLELARRRVRSVMDLSIATGLPVLAALPGNPRAISNRVRPPPILALANGSAA